MPTGPAVVAAVLATSIGGWFPAPTPPHDYAAGVYCDVPIHTEAVADHVKGTTLATYPDGSPRRQLFTGTLVVRVTNTDNGHSYDADASGTALIDYGTDGGQTWYVVGPVLAGFRDGGGNLPRGEWLLDGVYTLKITATGVKTLSVIVGHQRNVCDEID
jgi:hypothetical protein